MAYYGKYCYGTGKITDIKIGKLFEHSHAGHKIELKH